MLSGCGSTDPQYPSPPFFESEPAQFVDGDVSLGEPFLDLNTNGIWDADYSQPFGSLGEPFTDYSNDGQWTSAQDPWAGEIPYIDLNLNGRFDKPNGKFDGLPSRGRDEPWVYAIVNEGEAVCIPLPLTASADMLRIEVLPPATFSKSSLSVCWIPGTSGAQFLTVTATNGKGESDTLTIPAYATIRPVIDSIVPAAAVAGATVGLAMYTRHHDYAIFQPTFPPGLVIHGTLGWNTYQCDSCHIGFGVREDAPAGEYQIGLMIPGLITSGNTVTFTVTE